MTSRSALLTIAKAIMTICATTACDPMVGPTVIPDRVTCASCKVNAREGVLIGDTDGPGMLVTAAGHVATDERGRFLVYAGQLPQVFDHEGHFVSIIGAPGRGPGEFSGPAYPIAVANDSILVIQPGNARAALFDGDLNFVRQIALPGMMSASVHMLSWPDSVVLTGQVQSADHFGDLLHIASLSTPIAGLLKSGGPHDLISEDRFYVLSVPHDGQIWGVQLGTYKLERWTSQLERAASLERRPRWWSTRYEPLGSRHSPPTPVVQRVLVDTTGLLWIFIRVAAPTWRDAWPDDGRVEVPSVSISYDKLFETIIEVIDPAAKRVVVRSRLNMPVFAVLPGPRAVAFRPDPDGTPRLQVLHLSITK